MEISLQELTNNPGKIYHHSDTLEPYHPGYNTAGTLTYSVAYFTYVRSHPSQHFKDHMILPGSDKGEKKLYSERHFPNHDTQAHEPADSPSHQYGERMRMALDGKIPPSIDTRSGMLVIQIHQIANLEVPSTREHVGKTKKGEHLEEGSIPSSYAFVLLNDQKIYETRVKRNSTDPYIVRTWTLQLSVACLTKLDQNAGTERFVRDWPRARVDIVVMDARMREHDAIIGVISLPLAEVLSKRSQVTRWWPLVGGVGKSRLGQPAKQMLTRSRPGYGRMRASLLFKAIAIEIERRARFTFFPQISADNHRSATRLGYWHSRNSQDQH